MDWPYAEPHFCLDWPVPKDYFTCPVETSAIQHSPAPQSLAEECHLGRSPQLSLSLLASSNAVVRELTVLGWLVWCGGSSVVPCLEVLIAYCLTVWAVSSEIVLIVVLGSLWGDGNSWRSTAVALMIEEGTILAVILSTVDTFFVGCHSSQQKLWLMV